MATTIASTDVGGTGLSTVGTNGQVLTSNGTTLSWQTPSAGTSFSAGTTGFTPNTATTGTVTLAGTLGTANGGTNLTSFTSGGALYATSTSVLTTGTLPVTAGGTGLTSFTANQIHYGSFSTSSVFVYTSTGLGIGTSTPNGILNTNLSNLSTVGLLANSGLNITTGGGAIGNIYQIGLGYGAASTYASSAIYGLTTDSAGYNATAICFATRTATTDTAPTERMRITSAGLVGIGTTTPSYQLDVTTASNTDGIQTTVNNQNIGIKITNTNTSYDAVLRMQTNGHFADIRQVSGNAITMGIDGTERMRIDSSGNVAINTTSGTGGRLVIVQNNATQPAIYLPTDESTIQGPGTNTQIRMGGNLVLQSGNVTNISAKNAAGYIQFLTGATPTEYMRITSAGGVSFGATGTAYGTSGQVLTSAGNAPPTWGAVAGVGVAKAYGFINNQSGSAVTYNTLGVSSVTQTNTGRNTINWTTAFATAQYIIVATTNKGDSNYDMNSIVNTGTTTGVNQTTTQAFLGNGYSSNFQNSCQVCFVVFYPS
jgi:hypothetical protein